MRINGYTHKPVYNQNFNGLLHVDRNNGNINDSWFFRDPDALKLSSDTIKIAFPEGADILDYACSNGEETISLKTLLQDPKYRIIGYDTSTDAIKLGRRGVYTLFSNWHDSYLLPPKYYFIENNKKYAGLPPETIKHLRRNFNSVMEEIPEQKEYRNINNKSSFVSLKYNIPNFVEKFYKPKAEFTDQIDLRLGNIINIGNIRKERPIGGIFFRNAFYHLCDNNIVEVINQNAKINQSTYSRYRIIDYIIDGVDKVLDNKGVFVIGNNIKDHLFLADESLPLSKTIPFSQTSFYNPIMKHHQKYANLLCYKTSPLITSLIKHKFRPIGFSIVSLRTKKIKLPTVWQKIRL